MLVSGCAKETITEKELVSRVVEVYQEIETVRFDIDITAEVEFQTEKFAGISEMTTTVSGVLGNVNEDMKENREVSFLQLPGQPGKVNMFTEMYLIDNIILKN